MSKLGTLIGRKPSVPAVGEKSGVADKIAVPEIITGPPAEPEAREIPPKNILELDNELFLPAATQLGEENESIRNLLIEAAHKLEELDAIKLSVRKLIDPVSKTLRALEESKAEKIGLQSALNTARITTSNLRTELGSAEKKVAVLESECARLRESLTVTQQRAAVLESSKGEQTNELAARRAQAADLQRRVQQQNGELQVARDESRRLGERITVADKRIVQLEGEIEALQQKLMVSEKERTTVQASLEKTLTELTQVSQRLHDIDKALAATQLRSQKTEQALAEAEAERHRLATALDDARQKHESEIISHRTNYETLQARAALTEKLLEEARQSLMERSEEIRTFDRRLSDSTRTHTVIGEKLGLIEEALAERNAKIKELENARATLAEQNDMLSKSVNTRESAYNRAQEHILQLEERIQLLESEVKAARQSHEAELEVLNAKLQREQVARTMAEGALEAGRKDIARLVQEVASLQYRPNSQSDNAQGSADPASEPSEPEKTDQPGSARAA